MARKICAYFIQKAGHNVMVTLCDMIQLMLITTLGHTVINTMQNELMKIIISEIDKVVPAHPPFSPN